MPYLNFIMDDVFLRFNQRGYKVQSEKWRIACVCTEIFNRILQHYRVSQFDFKEQVAESGNRVQIPKSPGFFLMHLCLSSSPFLKMIMSIIVHGSCNNNLLAQR